MNEKAKKTAANGSGCGCGVWQMLNLVKKRASGDGGKVLWNWPHISVWEPYVASWLETQPGNILQIKGLTPHQKVGIKPN